MDESLIAPGARPEQIIPSPVPPTPAAPPPQGQPAQPKQRGSFQNSKAFIIIPIVLIIIVIVVGTFLILTK